MARHQRHGLVKIFQRFLEMSDALVQGPAIEPDQTVARIAFERALIACKRFVDAAQLLQGGAATEPSFDGIGRQRQEAVERTNRLHTPPQLEQSQGTVEKRAGKVWVLRQHLIE